MRLSHSLEYFAVKAFAMLVCLLPRRAALALGAGLGRLGWLLRARRDLVLANLAQALPHATPAERSRIGARAARNFGVTVSEFIRIGSKERGRVLATVDIQGIEPLRAALGEGKGALLLTGHLGAWAVYFGAVSSSGIPIALLVGKQHNEKVDKLIHAIPGDSVEFIPKGRSAVKRIAAKLREGGAIVMVADQHAGAAGVMAPFLGRDAPTLALPGAFAAKHGAPVFFMHGRRLDDGRHLVVIERIQLDSPPGSAALKEEVTLRYNEVLGKAVLACPEQYFWYHRRWRDSDLADREPQGDA